MSTRFQLLRGACVKFGQGAETVTVFEGFDLTVSTGHVVALMGPNGCGKSTVVRAILGIDSLCSGTVGISLAVADLAAAILQDYRSQLLPWLTVRENAVLHVGGAHDSGLGERSVYRAVQERLAALDLDLPADRKVAGLSGGEQQALILARAMVFSPRLWMVDEGLSAMDFRRRRLAHELIRSYSAGRTGLFVTHDLDEALEVCDRLLLCDTRMVVQGDWLIDRAVAEADPGSLDRIRVEVRARIAGAPHGGSAAV